MFNLQPFLDAANELTRLDEIERALHLLDNLPAKYRDQEPEEVTKLRAEITARIATPSYYAQSEVGMHVDLNDEHDMRSTLRYQMLAADVADFNEQGLTPHIVDYGPGPLWLPVSLKAHNLKFTYEPIVLADSSIVEAIRLFDEIVRCGPIPDQPYIFCAFEIIEHLWNEIDLKIEAYRHLPRLPDLIHVSTPMYAFDPECADWRLRDRLGHIRAYAPRELCITLGGLFREYQMKVFTHQIMHARLCLNNAKFIAKEP